MIICDLNWWVILLSWLLPFILGYLLGSLFKGNSTQVESYRSNVNTHLTNNSQDIANSVELRRLNQRNLELESILVDCKKLNLQHEVRIRELEKELESSRSKTIIERTIPIVQKPLSSDIEASPSSKSDSKTSIVANAKVEYDEKLDIDYSVFQKLSKNNLQIFEGLGPKMESFLNSENVYTWEDLSSQNANELKRKLELLDPKYRILEPESWPKQAKLACEQSWSQLVQYQKQLSAGKSKDDTIITESKLEKILVKMGLLRRYKKDDFKAIEGIGPKIESLLHDSGIWTWSQLSIFDVKALKAILEKAGDRYQLADPTTWPYQASLANEGKWKELFDYQDTLKGGKIV